MRLKKLVLHGFKSFADRTEFVFDDAITGIVGPNGCGKSNVVDGFKWVLGEQSAKSLRGDAMMDVIFNGAAGRKPGGMAEVTLIFDNPRRDDGSRTLNVEAEEVSVGRRLFRDGTSEYQLNNQATRLKDIRELFLDTGVGVDAYSVIEQGKVSAMLEANPQERRVIFEEAAGISKFKAKKKEAQRKLEKVDQNLLRVHDIVEEVEKRLRSVKVQAGRARTYQEHSTRLRELRLQYALQEYHTQFTKINELTGTEEDARFRLDDLGGELNHHSRQLDEKREQVEVFRQRKQQVEHELVQTRAAMENAAQRQQYGERQLAQLLEQIRDFERDRADAEKKLAEVTESIESETARLTRLTEELSAHRTRIDQRQKAFHDGQLQLSEINRQIERGKSVILDLMRRGALVNSRLGAIEIEQKNIAAQQQRLEQRREQVAGELSALESRRTELQQLLESTLAELAGEQEQVEAHKAQAAALGKRIADLSGQLGSAREHRSGLLSRQRLLEDLEARREGVSEGVKSVLRRRDSDFPFIQGLVADVLRVDVEHAHVIEAALDGRDQLLVSRDPTAVEGAAEKLGELEGRVGILCLPEGSDSSDPAADDFAAAEVRLALDLVRVEPLHRDIARHLLGQTAVVDDLAIAGQLRRSGPAGFRYVTAEGEVLEADGTLRAGPLTAAMGLLSRRSELDSLTGQIAEVDARIERIAAKITQDNEQARAIEENLNSLRNSIDQTHTRKIEQTSQIAQVNDKQQALWRERPVLERELETLGRQLEKLAVEQAHLSDQRGQLEAEQAQRQQQVEEDSSRQAQTQTDLQTCAEELTSARIELGQVQEKQLASQQAVQRQTAAQNELRQQIERLTSSAQAVAARQSAVRDELEQARAAQEQAQHRAGELTDRLESLAAELTAGVQAVQVLGAKESEIRDRHAEVEKELHQVQMQLGELRVRVESVVQRAMEELQLDVPGRYTELTGGENPPGYNPGQTDWAAVAEEIRVLKEKIQRLGNVNLDAINDQDELEKRSEFLNAQVADLIDGKRQLEELIETINIESGARFADTFERVREHFQSMFRKLFGGGKADILLETEVIDTKAEKQLGPDGQTLLPIVRKIDPLDAGIEIIAHPPGKKPVSISQLSGGEKTMTCVALLMSIFKSKPSPFCILDEVDAALDEANNQRFNLIVQEFLEQSQFIVITHSKRTMQIAETLYGVTMQEQGVSKRVAVKFDQVDSQGRIAETAAA